MTYKQLNDKFLRIHKKYGNLLYANNTSAYIILESFFEPDEQKDIFDNADSNRSITNEFEEKFRKFEMQMRETIDECQKYGATSDLKVLYEMFSYEAYVEEMLKSNVKDTLVQIGKRFKNRKDALVKTNIIPYYNPWGTDTDAIIKKKFGKEYTDNFISVMVAGIWADLDRGISNKILQDTSKQLTGGYDYSSIDSIKGKIGKNSLFMTLGCDFKDKRYWPYRDNILELIQKQLKNFNFDKSKADKMNMLGIKEYNGLSLEGNIAVWILKVAVDKVLRQQNEKGN